MIRLAIIILFSLLYSSVNAQWLSQEGFDHAYGTLKNHDCNDCNYFNENKSVVKDMLSLNIGIQNNIKKTWDEHIENLKNNGLIMIKDSLSKNESLNSNFKNKRRPLSNCFDRYPTFLTNYLLSYQDIIVPEYFKNVFEYKIVSDEIFKILGSFNLPQKLKDSLLHHPLVSLTVKAKLGDKNAEEFIINKFNNFFEEDSMTKFAQYDDAQFKELLKPLSFDLLYIGSNGTLNTFLKVMQSYVSRSSVIKETDSILFIEKKPVVYTLLDIYNTYYYNELSFFQKMVYSSEKIWELEKWEKDKIYIDVVSDYLATKHKTKISIPETKKDYIIFSPKYKMSETEILKYVIRHPL